MPVDYVGRIRQMDWPELRRLWEEIERSAAADWPPGRALEHLVLRAFELSGATVRWPYEVPILGKVVEQIDGAVHVGSLSCIVECKDVADPLNIDAVAKLRNQLLRRPAGAVGLLFSRNGFTKSAIMLARFVAPQNILLWGGEEIAYILEREDAPSALITKYRVSIEDGEPNGKILEEVIS
jgi:Restriction endonuclease